MHLVIAVATRERPRLLGELLRSLALVQRPVGVSVSLLVVENNSSIVSRAVVEGVDTGFETRHVLETRLGLVNARNRIFDEAIAMGADWVLALDDDQRVDAQWLEVLCRAIRARPQARIFSGLSSMHYTAPVTPWVTPFRFRPREFGTVIKDVPGANAAIHREVFGPTGAHLRFDDAFQFEGGEDIEFFRRAALHGFEALWVPDAIVHEDIRRDRLTLMGIFRRNRGSQRSRAHIRHKHLGAMRAAFTSLRLALRSCILALASLCLGVLLLPFNRSTAQKKLGEAFLRLSRVAGICDFYLGRSAQPYRQVKGD